MKLKNIILDTDIGPDCDDVAAIALLNIYADMGYCNILGIGHCTSNPYGAGAIDATCAYYGRPDIQIGTYAKEGFLSESKFMVYNRDMTMTLPNRYRESQPENVVSMYRRILSEQPDQSVEFIAIGPLNNLSDLLDTTADQFSDLSGIELVKRKVTRLVSMAGIFQPASEENAERLREFTTQPIEEYVEYNVKCDVPAARNVAANWPTPKEYLGFEAGLLKTCGPLQQHPDDNHPIKLSYKLYTKDGSRFSWDPLTVEYAIVPSGQHYKKSVSGTVRFDEQGRTVWTPDEQGADHYIMWNQPSDVIATDINALLMSM